MHQKLIPLIALCASIASQCANADPIRVDQSFTPPFFSTSAGVSLNVAHAQTFTAGLKGQLVAASVAIVESPPSTCTTCFLDFDIRRTYAGAPSSSPDSVLAHIRIPTSVLPQRAVEGPEDYYVFDLSSFDVLVAPGDQLAMVFTAISLTSDTPYLDMARLRGCASSSCRPFGDPYTRGESWFTNPSEGFPDWTPAENGGTEFSDVAFQTFVRPGHIPEPATVVLLAMGLGLVAPFANRERKRRL